MNQQEIFNIFKEKKAILEGHFLFTSGRHSSNYMQCAKILQDPVITSILVGEIIKDIKNLNIDLVIGPATGGIILAYEAARQLGVGAIFTEREGDKMALRRGFEIPEGAKVLVMEDVITTGGSIQEVIDIVIKRGGTVSAIGILVDRTGGKIDFGVPTYRVLSREMISYKPEECPLCKEGDRASSLGSRTL